MILDNFTSNAQVKIPSTSRHPTLIIPPVTLLFRSQKKSARKKLKKLQQQQQQQLDNNPFNTPDSLLPENTPSRSQVVTFSNNELTSPKITLKSNDNKVKPSEDSTNDKGKKRKQDHLTDNFNNSNLILTRYHPQQEEQA
ncbi:hypothetical protein RclHR1_10430002 [Rhizophagus clarus]|nr:hypothetical protein RclHR1_10430002 [Rhizophagus clarus]